MSVREIVAIVPCHNGADSIQLVVNALRNHDLVDRVVVVDDASRDESALKAVAAGAEVVLLSQNVGKGGALASGIATAPDADIYLLVDADTGESAISAASLLNAVVQDEADLVVGVLPSAGNRGGFGIVKRIAGWGIERSCGFRPQAPLSGQRAVRGEVLRSLRLAPRFGVEVGMTIDAVRSGARIVEESIAMDHRHRGRRLDGFLHRARQGTDIARALWPRLVSLRKRQALLIVSTLLVLMSCLVIAQHHQQTKGVALPGSERVRIVLVPGASWEQGDSSPVDTQRVAGAMTTGEAKDIIATVGAGTRDPDVEPSADIDVEVAIRRPSVEPGELVIVAGITTARQSPELRPVTVLGSGVTGTLTSSSTRRAGLVDLTDLAPTALSMQGKAIPPSMTGTPMRLVPGEPDGDGLAQLNRLSESSQDNQSKVVTAYVVVQTAVYLAVLALARRGRSHRLSVLAAAAIAAFPLATYMVRWGTSGYDLDLWSWSAISLLVVGMIVGMSFVAVRSPVAVLQRILIATIALLVADVLTGARLQIAGVFGSPPVLGTRYHGLGNPASVILLTATVLWGAIHVSRSSERSAALARTAAVFVLVGVIAGMPGLGSDVGGLISFALIGTAFFVLSKSRRPGWPALVLTASMGCCALAIASALDYLRSPEERTHLGNLVGRIADEGIAPFGEVLARKVEANLFGYGFPWNMGVVVLAAGMLYLIVIHRLGDKTLPPGSDVRMGAILALVGAMVSFVVNDSGVVVLALVSVFLGPYLIVHHRVSGASLMTLSVRNLTDPPRGSAPNTQKPEAIAP